jgi:hypothetical protein
MRRYLIGLALVGQFVLPTLASGQANNQQVTYLVCQRPSGCSTYLPGGVVPLDMAGTGYDAFSGVLNLTLASDPNTKLLDATWIRESSTISTSDPAEGGRIRAGYADPDVKRFDIDWQRGSSVTILLKGLGSGAPIVAYADIKAGFGLDKVSSFIAACAEFTSKAEVDAEVKDALIRVKEYDATMEAAARKAEAAVDAIESEPKAVVSQSKPKPTRKRK